MAKKKKLTPKEKQFALLISKGLSATQAARKAFGWRCEPHTSEHQKARDLGRTPRVKAEVKRVKKEDEKQAQVEAMTQTGTKFDWDNMRQFAYDRLVEIRDDPSIPGNSRWEAVKVLEKMFDPSKDINLIWLWIDLLWRYYSVHCPCCHKDFPLYQVNNNKLKGYRELNELPLDKEIKDALDRKLALLKEADGRRLPHDSQLPLLAAPERHVVGMGPARTGKSFLLAMFCLMAFMIPGVEIWVLGRIFDDAATEMEYMQEFLQSLFYPVHENMYDKYHDKTSGEIALVSRWGSEIRIKSGKAKGSITGRELELAAVAEPAWVDGELFEEVRARMSSRLGRIIALGTPKGFGGFLHRMVKLAGRNTKGRRIKSEERLISAGCQWDKSLIEYRMDPTHNPEYVKAELEAARSELTEEEYAAEFEGLMMHGAGAKFPFIKQEHCRPIHREELTGASFVLGIDQGERNFGASLLAWDGQQVYTVYEYFDNSNSTIKANLIKLNMEIPAIIGIAGGNPNNWKLTIFDSDPIPHNTLEELKDECRGWRSDYTTKPKNKPEFLDWKEETCEWVNTRAQQNRMWFDSERADIIHDQLVEALRVPEGTPGKKVWIINDALRGEHVVDAWLMAMFAVFSGQVEVEEPWNEDRLPAYEEARRMQDYQREVREKRELTGYKNYRGRLTEEEQMFKDYFGRRRGHGRLLGGMSGWYKDES